jgi:hypothetical protein
MTTPWGIVFNQDVLIIVHDNLSIIVSNNHMNGSILFLRKRLGLDAGLNLAVNKVLNEGTNILLSKCFALVEGEFLVLDSLLDGEGGPLVDLQVEITSVGSESLSVDGGEVDNTFVLLSEGLEGVCELFAFFRGLGEDVGQGDTSLGFVRILFEVLSGPKLTSIYPA